MAVDDARRKEEDKHFHERDRELIAKLRAKSEAERQEKERKHRKDTHWMKCPKCGQKARVQKSWLRS